MFKKRRSLRTLFTAFLFLFAEAIAGSIAHASQTGSSTDTTSIPPLRSGSGIESSDAGRDWLKYIVRCALPAGSKVAVPNGDGKNVLEGMFGVAPEWAHARLSDTGERWVSACLLAFVNALGEHVLVSVRGDQASLKSTVTAEERIEFSFQEAAFYGNLFSEDGAQYVCRGKGGDVPSPSRSKRLCSDPSERPGVSRCGMIITGNCRDVCSVDDSVDHFVTHCRGGDRVYDEVVTVFLPVHKS
jgi:hypothetical protein